MLTLLTDFGLADGTVAAMKARILTIAPDVGRGGQRFVGPDNGLLGRAVGEPVRCIELDPERVSPGAASSATFHGRDLFAPAAARLLRGDDPSQLGSAGAAPQVLPPSAAAHGDRVEGEVLWIDHFGNALTEIESRWLPEPGSPCEVRCGSLVIHRLCQTYADVLSGEVLAYVGSAGTLELGLRDGHLGAAYGIVPGARITIRRARRTDAGKGAPWT